MTALLYVVSLLLAVLMGFAVHRASLCMVRTVAEILSTRRAYMMLTMLKAVLLGFSGGVLYALHDAWTYTNALKRQVQSLWLPIEQALTVNLLLFLALFGGMLLSAWQRGRLRLRWHRIRAWPRHFIGGGP
jgi:hypothetical protein